MKSNELIAKLDQAFSIAEIFDQWHWNFDDEFKKRAEPKFMIPAHNTGLMVDYTDEVNHIYTAFSPSTFVLEQIVKAGIKGVLLVVKHAFDWDGSSKGIGFSPFSLRDYQLMDEGQISIYSLHSPWDRNRNDIFVSTAYGFAKKIGLRVEREFAEDPDNPGLVLGLIGTLPVDTIDDLQKNLTATLGYPVKVFKKQDQVKKVAIVTGGGFIPSLIREAIDLGCDTYITGIITSNAAAYSLNSYPKTKAKVDLLPINVVGASHYLTEKWAPQFSVPYFEQFAPSSFIEDASALTKLE